MRFLGRGKEERKVEKVTQISEINMNIGTVRPFTALSTDVQFSNFLAELCNNKNNGLKPEEKEAFDSLWNMCCMGGSDYGLNNLRKGRYVVFKKDDIIMGFEKKTAVVEDRYNSDYGRTTVFYKSPDGNIVFKQHERNRDIMLVYISEQINSRLLNALLMSEAYALDIRYDGYKEDNIVFGMPIQEAEKMSKLK